MNKTGRLNLCHRTAGTSSFGMSGVNAHMLLTAGRMPARTLHAALVLPWRRGRYWPAPFVHSLCTPTSSSRGHLQRYQESAKVLRCRKLAY